MERNQNELKVIPYVEIDGARTVSDSYLIDIFNRMVEDNVVSIIFGGVLMRDAGDFIRHMKYQGNIPIFVEIEGICVGFAWLNHVGANNAYGHFCYFKNLLCDSMEFGHAVLDYWFALQNGNGKPLLDVIVGLVPAFNEKASHYVQKLGFTKVGVIPSLYTNFTTGETHASIVHYLERQ